MRSGPVLLGFGGQAFELIKDRRWRDLPPHKDESQVELDVNRSFIYYPTSIIPKDDRNNHLLTFR